jgi:hypothetical protein
MQTEFTCGIYTAIYSASFDNWALTVNNRPIAIIDNTGWVIKIDQALIISVDDLIEISVLMNNIKRQYKQLQQNTA